MKSTRTAVVSLHAANTFTKSGAGHLTRHPHQFPKKTVLAVALIAVFSVGTQVAMAGTGTVTGGTAGTDYTTITDPPEITITGTVAGVTLGTDDTLKLLTVSGSVTNGAALGASDEGINNLGTINTISTTGLISGTETGIYNYGGTPTVINNDGGTILGGTDGIRNDNRLSNGTFASGHIDTISNTDNGTIYGTLAGVFNEGAGIAVLFNTGNIAGGEYGIQNSVSTIGGVAYFGTINDIANLGIIHGNVYGIYNDAATINTILNYGTISGGVASSSANNMGSVAIYNNGTISSIDNGVGGTIIGLGTNEDTEGAVFNDNDGRIGTIHNEGLISGVTSGIANNGSITSLTNSGTIIQQGSSDSDDGGAITNNENASITALENTSTGLIEGTHAAIQNAGTIGSLINNGLITAPVAIDNTEQGTFGLITNAGVIAGNIINSATTGLTISGGTGSLFGTLTGYKDAVGSITNTNADLTFASGNIWLNDSIDVGTNTVRNTGATLEVDGATTITGNYSQGQAATLLVGVAGGATTTADIASDAGYGRLVVTGNATIDANSSVQLKSTGGDFGFTAGQRFVVVDAAGTGAYNEASLKYSILGYTGTVEGTAVTTADGHTDLVLKVIAARSDSGADDATVKATTDVAIAASEGLLNYQTGTDEKTLQAYDAFLALSATGSVEALNRAGAEIANTSSAAIARAAAAPTYEMLDVIGTHLDDLRLAQRNNVSGIATGEGTFSTVSSTRATGVWGQAFGGHASQGDRDGVDGYSANFGGLLFGVDRPLNDAWRVGGAFSYSNVAVNNTGYTAGDTTRVNAYGLTGYGSYIADRWYANLSAGAILQRYNSTRKIDFPGFSGTAGASFGGEQYVVRGEVGMPLTVGPVTVTPLAALTYSYQHQGSYTEDGGNGLALSVGTAHLTSVKSDLGARFQHEFATRYGSLVPQLTVAWRHEYDNTRTTAASQLADDAIGETAFTTAGSSPVANMAVIGMGVTLLRANNMSISARYDVQAGKGYLSQAGSIKLRQLF